MSYIFISYAHEDNKFAKDLIKQISDAGFISWIDSEHLRAGEDWRQVIDEAIEDSFALIVIMTPDAKLSEYVTYEWSYALGAKISVIPVLLKRADLHPRLDLLQYLDFTDNTLIIWDRLINRLREIYQERGIRIFCPPDAPQNIRRAFINLNSLDHEKRKSAARTLGNISGTDATAGLLVALCDHYKEVRKTAAQALIDKQRSGDKSALTGLFGKLQDNDADVRRLAAWVLGDIQDKRAISHLINAAHDNKGIVRGHIAGALSNFPNSLPVVETLYEMLSDKSPYIDDETYNTIYICNVALNALIHIGTPEALAAVEQWRRENEIE